MIACIFNAPHFFDPTGSAHQEGHPVAEEGTPPSIPACEKSHRLLTLYGTSMSARRTHIVIPESLVSEIDRLVGKRGRSEFLTQAAEKELRRLQQIKALEGAAGAWKDKDHPELRSGAAQWVRELRKEGDRRLRKAASR